MTTVIEISMKARNMGKETIFFNFLLVKLGVQKKCGPNWKFALTINIIPIARRADENRHAAVMIIVNLLVKIFR